MKSGSGQASLEETRTAKKAVNEAPEAPSKPEEAATIGDDRALVERVQRGDEAAFRLLFEKYNKRAYAVALGVVKDKQDAHDVVQDAFIKVHRHIGSFQGTSSFYTWLYRILMNLAIDHVRKHQKSKKLDYDDRVQRDSGEIAAAGLPVPSVGDGNPAKLNARKELSRKLQAALMELPEYHRAVILLREVEGLSYEEMSDVLKVPKGTIMSRLFHARKKMQEALKDYVGDEMVAHEESEEKP